MTQPPSSVSRVAAWLADDPDSALERALSNPAALGIGTDLIGFASGQPATELYPLEALQRAFSRAILEDSRFVLPYGPTEGLLALREIVVERLARRGIEVTPAEVMITTGSTQGLHLVGRVLLDHGDTILTEAPTFMGALGTWEHQQPRYVCVPVDADGMLVDALPDVLSAAPRPPKFVYLLPTFQNPSGVSLTLARRQRLLELAEQLDLLIVEDDPYAEFWYDEGVPPTPPVRALPGAADRVIYLGTFSKVLAPGLRLGFAVARRELIDVLLRAKRGVDLHTDGLIQQGVVRLLQDPEWDLEEHIAVGRAEYRARRDALLDALETTLSSEHRWTRPGGGYFLWLDMADGLSADRVTDAALAEGVAVPGAVFYPNADGGHSALRLSFSSATPERIREGVRRLQRAIETISV